MKQQTELLIADLIERTKQNLNKAEELKQQPLSKLNKKSTAESWSALECLEHLNLYGDYYMPEIRKRIAESKHKSDVEFKSGLLGNYFALGMLPKEKLNTMKTFADKNPNGSKLDVSTIDRFIEQQKQTLDLLDKVRKVSLTKTKTSITISKLIKLRLGDTFRVIIYHNQRHLVQAFNALK